MVNRRLTSLMLAASIAACVSVKSAPAEQTPLEVQPHVEVGSIDVSDAGSPNLASRRVLIVGDSEACAVGFVARDVVKKINDEASAPRDVINVSCKSGTVVQYWGEQDHLREALMQFPKPDIVIVFLGTNHYWQVTGKAPDVSKVLSEIAESGAKCIWVGNTAVKGKKWPINRMLRAAVAHQCTYFDTELANIPLIDGIHPDRVGSTRWLRLIWPMLPLKFEEQHVD